MKLKDRIAYLKRVLERANERADCAERALSVLCGPNPPEWIECGGFRACLVHAECADGGVVVVGDGEPVRHAALPFETWKERVRGLPNRAEYAKYRYVLGGLIADRDERLAAAARRRPAVVRVVHTVEPAPVREGGAL